MSDYLRELDKQRERDAAANLKYQEYLHKRDPVGREPPNKRKTVRICIEFILFLIIMIVILVVVGVSW